MAQVSDERPYERLRQAMDTAALACEAGLDLVVAPVPPRHRAKPSCS
ncbi:hypothetical protein [Streptomyces sp. Je 1-332]